MRKTFIGLLLFILTLALVFASCDYGDFNSAESKSTEQQGQDESSLEVSIISEDVSELEETISEEEYISEDNESEEESSREEENLAAGKSYTFTGIYRSPETNEAHYSDNENYKLTDGVIGSVSDIGYNSDIWVGLNWKGEGAFCEDTTWSANTIAINSITIDLESSEDVYLFSLFIEDVGSGIHKPKSVEVFISEDNINYTSIGSTQAKFIVEAKNYDNTSYGMYVYWLALSEAVTARYVKFVITHGGAWTFVSEVEIYG